MSLDPAEANELSSIQTVPSLYQRVVQPDRNDPTKITPILAESWQADPAAKTLTIKLKSDAKFASGNPVRPEDVIYSYVRAVTLNKSGAFILNVLGWQPENIASQLRKSMTIPSGTMECRRQPGAGTEYSLHTNRLNC